MDELMDIVTDIEETGARRRLLAWVAGEKDCDELFAPAYHYRTSHWDLGDLGPRRDPDDIVITEFERKVGAEIEKNWKGKIAAEFR